MKNEQKPEAEKPLNQIKAELEEVIVEAVPSAGYRDPFNVVNPDARLPNEHITLEDVLIALDQNDEVWEYDEGKDSPSEYWAVGVMCSGSFLQVDYMAGGYLTHHGSYQWQLGKPLSEQSPETISFLHSLLVS